MTLEVTLAVKCPYCFSKIVVNADDFPAFHSGLTIYGYCENGHKIPFRRSAYKRKEGE